MRLRRACGMLCETMRDRPDKMKCSSRRLVLVFEYISCCSRFLATVVRPRKWMLVTVDLLIRRVHAASEQEGMSLHCFDITLAFGSQHMLG